MKKILLALVVSSGMGTLHTADWTSWLGHWALFPTPSAGKGVNVNVQVTNNNSLTSFMVGTGLYDLWERGYQTTQGLTAALWSLGCTYKKRFLCLTLIGGYGILHYRLRSLEQFMRDPQRWCHWQETVLLQPHTTTLPHELERQLLTEIQARYMQPGYPTDFVRPLVAFMNAITYEIQQLEAYKKLLERLASWRIAPYCSIDADPAKNIDAYLQRAVYIKSLFISWAVHYKLHAGHTLFNERDETTWPGTQALFSQPRCESLPRD